MALTHDFRETVRARARRDPDFRREFLKEHLKRLLASDFATARVVLRDYLNTTTRPFGHTFSRQ